MTREEFSEPFRFGSGVKQVGFRREKDSRGNSESSGSLRQRALAQRPAADRHRCRRGGGNLPRDSLSLFPFAGNAVGGGCALRCRWPPVKRSGEGNGQPAGGQKIFRLDFFSAWSFFSSRAEIFRGGDSQGVHRRTIPQSGRLSLSANAVSTPPKAIIANIANCTIRELIQTLRSFGQALPFQ